MCTVYIPIVQYILLVHTIPCTVDNGGFVTSVTLGVVIVLLHSVWPVRKFQTTAFSRSGLASTCHLPGQGPGGGRIRAHRPKMAAKKVTLARNLLRKQQSPIRRHCRRLPLLPSNPDGQAFATSELARSSRHSSTAPANIPHLIHRCEQQYRGDLALYCAVLTTVLLYNHAPVVQSYHTC